jgi:type II secretory pathway pseudopilin PulG
MKICSLPQRIPSACSDEFCIDNPEAAHAAGSSVRPRLGQESAFSLVEALVAIVILGLVAVALYAGFTSCFFSIRLARENLRATQIMLEKMEIIRLLTWEQLNSPNIMPTKFTAAYEANGSPNAPNSLVYEGKITIASVSKSDLNVSYLDDLRMVTVQLSWKTGSLDRSRKIISYVSRYGLQNYVFN